MTCKEAVGCPAAQSTAKESQQQTRSTAKEVAELQAQLDSITKQHNARTQELYVKFAAVVNEKKRKCRELRDAVETAQATLQVERVRTLHATNMLQTSVPS